MGAHVRVYACRGGRTTSIREMITMAQGHNFMYVADGRDGRARAGLCWFIHESIRPSGISEDLVYANARCMRRLRVGKSRRSNSMRWSIVAQCQRIIVDGVPSLHLTSLRTVHLFVIVMFHSMTSFRDQMRKLDGGCT